MLVLSRKPNETIVVGDAIEVTVLEILGERVKIGINAPRDVPIVRQELLHQTRTDHLAAAQPDALPPLRPNATLIPDPRTGAVRRRAAVGRGCNASLGARSRLSLIPAR